MKKTLYFFLALLTALSGIISYRTYTFVSQQAIGIEPLPPTAVSDSAATRLSEAVQVRTISYDRSPTDSAAMYALHRLLETHFPHCHRQLKREAIAQYSLLYEWRGTQPDLAPLLLIAHLDVVPAADSTDWTMPPFSGTISNDTLWGRGALDDKVSVWGIMEAAEKLLAAGFQPQRTIYFGFGHDEEMGGKGAQTIAATLEQRGIKVGFLLDEGMVITQGIAPALPKPLASVGLAEKGYVSLQLTATAEGGHSSMPAPQTAAGMLCRAVADLEANPMPQQITPITQAMFDAMGPEMDLPLRAVFANQWLLTPLIKRALAQSKATNATTRTTAAPTMLQGSPKENVLAREASAIINFRILPSETIDDVVAHVRRIVNNPDIRIDTLPGGNNPSIVADTKEGGYFDYISRSIKEVFPAAVVAPGLTVATTDARHYERVTDNAFRFLPIVLNQTDLNSIHGKDERICLSDYKNAIRFYERLMSNTSALAQ